MSTNSDDARFYPPCQKTIMENKTKLVLLEFFSLIPHDQNDEVDGLNESKTTEEVIKGLPPKQKTLDVVDTSSSSKVKERTERKYHTYSISEDERKDLMDQIAAHMKNEKGKLMVRSKSYETKEYYITMRKKMQQMLIPIRDFVSRNIQKGLVDLKTNLVNDKELHKTRRNIFRRISFNPGCGCIKKKKRPRKNLRIDIPRLSEMRQKDALESANTYAVNRLEEISNDIMQTFPDLLSGPVCQILTPLRESRRIPYSVFADAARALLMSQLQGVMSCIWHQVSLLMALARETMVVGNLDVDMMEIMVDHSTKFFMENVVETIEEEGGWDMLNILSSDDECCEEDFSCACATTNNGGTPGLKEGTTIYDWVPFAVAVMAVGLGLAFALR